MRACLSKINKQNVLIFYISLDFCAKMEDTKLSMQGSLRPSKYFNSCKLFMTGIVWYNWPI